MHRHRGMYHGFHGPYPYHPYGMNTYSPYETFDPSPMHNVNSFPPPFYHDYPYGRGFPCVDYPCYDYMPRVIPRPPVVQTNVRNDVCYYMDEPSNVYDDDYGHPYRLSRSKVQFVDVAPRSRPPRDTNRMVVSTFQPRGGERILAPRSTAGRHPSVPSYERQRRTRLMPLYHSADPQYVMPSRRRSVVREIVPMATVANSHDNRQTIRVRSLSPL